MSTIGFAQTKYPVQITTGSSATFLVQSMEGSEGLSEIFEFRVRLLSESSSVSFDDLVGKSVTLTIAGADGVARNVNGIVARFRQTGGGLRLVQYSADICPKLWLLTKAANCRIFQNKSVPDIVKQILQDHSVTDVKDSLGSSYDPREYCVQYQESDFAFISRLMESEGIFYFFEHTSSAHTMVLADDASAFATGPSGLKVSPSEAGFERADAIPDPVHSMAVVSGQTKSDDYDFETPATDLLGVASGDDTSLSVYEYPANQTQQSKVEALMTIRLEELEVSAETLDGSTRTAGIRAGAKVTLSDHPRSEVNVAWAMRRVSHHADQESYSNQFEAIPAATPFRPPRITPSPVVAGCQTALVVGKSGEEIWTDSYGRIKVQFFWDQLGTKDENSSCWIRVMQGWAGQGWGSMIIPRIGQEVVVSFLEGNPDRPLVTGCVYNATQTVPYALPANQTRTTLKSNSSKGGAGFNEIRFEDKKDSEELFIQAQKDLVMNVLNDETDTVTRNRTRKVTGDEAVTVSGKRTMKVTGNEDHTNSANLDYTVSGDMTIKVTGKLSIEATGGISMKSSGDIDMEASGNVNISAGMAVNIKAGTTMALSAGTSMSIKAVSIATDASATIATKAGATQNVEAGAILVLKGALVQIN